MSIIRLMGFIGNGAGPGGGVDNTPANIFSWGDSNNAFSTYMNAALDPTKFYLPADNNQYPGYTFSSAFSLLPSILPLYNGAITRNIITVMFGTNDIRNGVGLSTIQTSAQELIAELKNEGFLVLVVIPGEPDHDHTGPDNVSVYPLWDDFRDWYRANWSTYLNADGLVDLSSDTFVGQYRNDNSSYWNVDKIHYSASGYQRIGELVAVGVQAVYDL